MVLILLLFKNHLLTRFCDKANHWNQPIDLDSWIERVRALAYSNMVSGIFECSAGRSRHHQIQRT